MSDVGLTSELTLDIRNAIEQVARLEAALTAATSGIPVTAEAGAVTNEVSSAVDNADTEAEVTGEAGDVTSETEGAVDAADTEATITGDADEIPGEVTSAVDAADTEATITGDASEIPGEIDSAVTSSDAEVEIIGDAGEIPPEIEGAIGSVDTNVPIRGDASELVGELNRAEGATNDLERSVDFVREALHHLGPALGAAAIAKFIEGAVEATENFNSQLEVTEQLIESTGGTAKLTFEDLTGSAGEISKALGVTKGSVLGVQNIMLTFKQVSGDTFNQAIKLAFDMSRVLGSDATGAALQLGIALNDPVRGVTRLRRAGVQMTATQLEQIKAFVEAGNVLGAQKIILAEVESQLGGTAEASAKMSDKITVAGKAVRGQFAQPLVAVIDDLGPRFIQALGSMGGGAQATGEILAEALRAFLEVLIALTPALGSTTALLAAVTPIVQAFAVAIDAIPDPILQLAAAFLFVSRLAPALAAGLAAVSGGLTGMIAPATAVEGAFAGTAVASTGLAGALSRINPAIALGAVALTLWTQRQQNARKAAEATEAQISSFAEGLKEATDVGESYAATLTKAVEGQEKFTFQVALTGKTVDEDLAQLLGDAGVTVDQFTSKIGLSDDGFKAWLESLVRSGAATDKTVSGLVNLRDQMQQAAERTIEAGVATENWSDKQAEAALEANTAKDGTVDYAGALTQLKSGQEEATVATEDQTAATVAAKEAMTSLREEAPLVTQAIAQLAGPDSDLTGGFIGLALAIGQASLSEEQMGAVAAQLGVPLSELQANVEQVTASVESFVSGVQSSLPSISSNLSSLGEDVTFEGIREEFAKTLEAMVNFEANLAVLAAFPNVQAAAAAAGPEVAAALAQGVKDGKTQAVAAMEQQAIGISQTEQSIIDTSRNVYGPNFAAAQAAAGIGGTQAFSRTFNLSGHTSATGSAAVNIMRSKAAELESGARGGGSRASEGFRSGVSTMPAHAATAAARARANIVSTNGYSAGFSVGSNVGAGFAAGVDSYAGAAADKAAQLVLSAKAAANRAARSGSPSKVFMEIGGFIGQGLAVGIENETSSVVAATAGVIEAAAGEVARVGPLGVDVSGAGAAAASGTVINVAPGAVVVNLPPGSTAADQSRVLREASAAFWGPLSDRRITAGARAQ